jgi:hypothetical protein
VSDSAFDQIAFSGDKQAMSHRVGYPVAVRIIAI